MTTAYTPILKLALPVTGELSGTWGTVVNDNITSMVEQAVAGLATISTWTANAHTLTTADGTSSEARCAMLVLATGAGGTALTAAGEVICPAASKLYVVKNGSAYAVTVKTSAGTGVAIPAGDTAFVFCDGTNVNACVTTIVNGHISGNLTVDGNTTLGDATSDTITATARFNTDLLPSTDNARDLGSTANSWRTLYCDTSVLTPLVTATNLQVTNIKANDGTAAMSIADSTGIVTVSSQLQVDNLNFSVNTISSTNTNGNIVLAPNGTGDVYLDADTIRIGDSNANATLTTNGTGDLILNTNSGTNSGSITIADGANGNITISTNGTGITTMTTAVEMSATTQNIALGTSQTSGTFTVGGASQTGNITLDQSTKAHTLNIGSGATESGATKTINIGTGGVATSTTTMTIGSANGTTITLNGTVTAATFNSTTIDTTNLEVTNIKAKDGTAAIVLTDSTGAVTVSTLLTVDNLRLETNTLSSTNTNGDINVTPNGTGAVVLPLLRLSGSTSGYVGLKGAAAAGSTTYILPAADGTSGQVLSTNGAGTLSWVAAAASGVTSFSAGTTGLTPNTATTGVVTLAGTLAIANGGTGQTTAGAAFNALAPSQTGNNGKYLTTDGTNTSWATVSSGSPGGSDTQVQFNDGGSFGGDADFTWNKTTNTLTIAGINFGRGGGAVSANTAIGYQAINGTATGNNNTAVGFQSLLALSSGGANTAYGAYSGDSINSGSHNVVLGYNAGQTISSGNYNIAIGSDALGNANPSSSVGIGYRAGRYSTSSVIAIGHEALAENTSGAEHVAIGFQALDAIITNNNNTAVGHYALSGSIADDNTAFGNRAAINLTTGSGNTAIGSSAFSTSTVTGNNNTVLGYSVASTLTSGANNLILGYNATSSAATVSNEITLGNSSIATLRCQVTTITALSDARDKKDVQDIPLGVSFIQRLHPVSFVWNTRDGGKVGVPEFGFIAQELQQAQADHGVTLPGLVYDINPERLEAAPGTLIPVLVKAVQELQAQIDELKRQLAARG